MGDPEAERFKWAILHVAVGDPPWNTGMAWVDAVDAFPDRSAREIDDMVKDALLELLDEGYVWFFRRTDFDDEFRPRSEDEALAREEVAAILAEGRLPDDSSSSPTTSVVSLAGDEGGDTPRQGRGARVSLNEVLSFRATRQGEEHHATLSDDQYRLFRRS